MEAKVKYLNSCWVQITIPKAVVILPMSQWRQGFCRGKSWKRRIQEQEREKRRKTI